MPPSLERFDARNQSWTDAVVIRDVGKCATIISYKRHDLLGELGCGRPRTPHVPVLTNLVRRICSVRPDEQVRRLPAPAIIAVVEHRHPYRNMADKTFVCRAMRQMIHGALRKRAIPVRPERAIPVQASRHLVVSRACGQYFSNAFSHQIAIAARQMWSDARSPRSISNSRDHWRPDAEQSR